MRFHNTKVKLLQKNAQMFLNPHPFKVAELLNIAVDNTKNLKIEIFTYFNEAQNEITTNVFSEHVNNENYFKFLKRFYDEMNLIFVGKKIGEMNSYERIFFGKWFTFNEWLTNEVFTILNETTVLRTDKKEYPKLSDTPFQTEKIYLDFQKLVENYNESQKKKWTLFLLFLKEKYKNELVVSDDKYFKFIIKNFEKVAKRKQESIHLDEAIKKTFYEFTN